MGSTPILHLPYPEITEPADVPADIKELALALDVAPPPARPFRVVSGMNAGYTLPYTSPNGWTLAKTATGTWTVTLTTALPTPFYAIATVIGAAQAVNIYTAQWDYAGSTATVLRFFTFYGAALTDAGFAFMAMGGRDPGGA